VSSNDETTAATPQRIDLTKELEWLHEPREDRSVGTISKHDVVVETDYIEGLIAELKRCYEEIDEVRGMLMQAYDGQKEREREIDYLRSYCLDNGVCPYCGEAQQDPALREHLGILKMCYSCEDKIHFGIEPNDNASE
jgi:hypothetical protein